MPLKASAPRHEDVRGSGGNATLFLTTGLYGRESAASRPGRFTSRKEATVAVG
jgi:hypothetical protein